jgi:hypothetical protein
MSDFLSINPAPETITINGKKIPVHGISMTGFGSLIPRFPNLINDLNERMKKDGALTLIGIMDVAGPAIGAILAAGLGYVGNEEAEQKAAQLDASTQLKLLDKIVEKTMPDGIGPFVEEWTKLMARFAPAPPRKMRFKVLQRESNPLSASVDTAKPMSGA